jgi:hypothetical protein
MEQKETDSFAEYVINTPQLRDALRRNIGQIGRLESLDSLIDLHILGISYVEDNLFSVEYGAVASPAIYPGAKDKLVEKKIINRGNIIKDYFENQGKSDEYEEVKLRVPGTKSLIQVSLRVYNPDYKF